jgi:hypothetical protein
MPAAVFAGVARNCERFLPWALATIGELAQQYERSDFVFAVSDSKDNSFNILREWLAGKAGIALDLGNLEPRMPKRTWRIAKARDACLEFIRACHWASYDELVMCDLDDVLTDPVDAEGFAGARAWLQAGDGRAAAFPSAAPVYYDIWALRHQNWCPNDCWHAIWGRSASEPLMAAKIREVHARQLALPIWMQAIPVRSAFGGMAIYKMKHLDSNIYSDVTSAGQEGNWEQCEHVHFNSQLADRGLELAIVPAWRVRAPSEHLFQYEGCAFKWHLRMWRTEIVAARNASRMFGVALGKSGRAWS